MQDDPCAPHDACGPFMLHVRWCYSVLVHVDDYFPLSTNPTWVADLEAHMSTHFEINNLGKEAKALGPGFFFNWEWLRTPAITIHWHDDWEVSTDWWHGKEYSPNSCWSSEVCTCTCMLFWPLSAATSLSSVSGLFYTSIRIACFIDFVRIFESFFYYPF